MEKSPGLPDSVLKVIKHTYLELCDRNLLKKCLHGMTQNNNECFNNVLWNILPKETFVEQKTLFFLITAIYGSNYSLILVI